MMNQLKIGWYVLQVNTYYFDNSFLISVGSPDIRCCISVMALECVWKGKKIITFYLFETINIFLSYSLLPLSLNSFFHTFIRTDVFRFKERSLPGNFVRSTGTTNASTIRFFWSCHCLHHWVYISQTSIVVLVPYCWNIIWYVSKVILSLIQ